MPIKYGKNVTFLKNVASIPTMDRKPRVNADIILYHLVKQKTSTKFTRITFNEDCLVNKYHFKRKKAIAAILNHRSVRQKFKSRMEKKSEVA